MKTPTNLVLSRAKTTAATDRPLNITMAAKPVVDEASDGPHIPDSSKATITVAGEDENGNKAAASPPAGKTDDGSKIYGTVIKSWTSRGVAGTGARSARIVATYPVVKNTITGIVDFADSTFELTFTDIDNETTSTIPSYAFAYIAPTQIPEPENGGQFDLNGTVRIFAQSSGRLLFVDFDMGGGSPEDAASTPRDIGSIFELNIPGDTVFAPKYSASTV